MTDEPSLTLDQARQQCRCRICGMRVHVGRQPIGWRNSFREMLVPIHLILNFGQEFAHAKCLGVADGR